MASNISTDADVVKDKDREPIHFSEEFRRAKRNSLFWSAVTIVISVLGSDPKLPLHVQLVVRDLDYQQATFIVFACLVVTIFMIVGYRRAEASLLARHTGFSVANRLHFAGELADKLVANLTAHQKRVETATHRLDQQLARVNSTGEEVIKNLERLRTHQKAYQGENHGSSVSPKLALLPEASGQKALVPRPLAEKDQYEKMRTIALEASSNAMAEAVRWLDEHNGRLTDAFTTERDRFLDRVRKSLQILKGELSDPPMDETPNTDEIDTELRSLAQSLHGFADTIGTGERRWFYLYDRTPVWVLAIVACSLALARLSAPVAFHDQVEQLFPAHRDEQPASTTGTVTAPLVANGAQRQSSGNSPNPVLSTSPANPAPSPAENEPASPPSPSPT